MTHQLQLSQVLAEVDGDTTRSKKTLWRKPEYDATFDETLTVGTTLTEIKHHLVEIQFVYIVVVTDDRTVEVHKNLSPEYWSVEDVFMAFSTDITQLSLKASAAGTQIYVFLGGEI